MQELITEIAIYLAVTALLGLILGYLLWGMGSRRRIEAARAEAAADVRTSVDGGSSLRKQVDELTQERDRLLHRVEVLSIRVASLMEASGGTEAAEDVAERMGMVRLDVSDNPDDRLDEAARSFPEPGDVGEPSADDLSIFDEQEEPEARSSGDDDVAPEPAHGAAPDSVDVDEEDRTEPQATNDTDEMPETREGSEEKTSLGTGLFERRDVEAPLRIREGLSDKTETPEASEIADADVDDMPPVPLRPRKPAMSDDEEIPPLRRRPLFAAAQALKPDVKPSPISGDSDLANSTADAFESGQSDSAENAADQRDETHTTDPSPEPPIETESDAVEEAFETTTTGAAAEDHPPEATSVEFSGDPDNADDLTRIKGIGKSTAKSLNALGIWQFEQIASLDQTGLDSLKSKLSAQMGRSLDKWSEQARLLSGSDDG